MNSNDEFKAIAELDLDPIKVKLMHRESGEGWTLEYANEMESEYRRFLCLMKAYPGEAIAPLFDVDIFWHYHILDTMKYAADCDSVFGHFLHHFPYLGLGGEEDAGEHQRVGERMKDLYQQTFGEPCDRALPGRARAEDGAVVAAGTAAWCFTPMTDTPVHAAGRNLPRAAGQTAWCFITLPEPPPIDTASRNARAAAENTAWCFTPESGIKIKASGLNTRDLSGTAGWCFATVQSSIKLNMPDRKARGAMAKTAWCFATESKHAAAPCQTAWRFMAGSEAFRLDRSHTKHQTLVT